MCIYIVPVVGKCAVHILKLSREINKNHFKYNYTSDISSRNKWVNILENISLYYRNCVSYFKSVQCRL